MNLKTLYDKLSGEERTRLAAEVGIHKQYLWQIATRWRDRRPSMSVVAKLAKADRRLKVEDMVREFTP